MTINGTGFIVWGRRQNSINSIRAFTFNASTAHTFSLRSPCHPSYLLIISTIRVSLCLRMQAKFISIADYDLIDIKSDRHEELTFLYKIALCTSVLLRYMLWNN